MTTALLTTKSGTFDNTKWHLRKAKRHLRDNKRHLRDNKQHFDLAQVAF